MDAKQKRMAAVLALVVGGATLTTIAVAGMGDSLVYYWNVQELLQNSEKAEGAAIRLGGMVQAGSHSFDSKTLDLSFVLGMGPDSNETVLVQANGAPPQMFREGIGVLVEGGYDGKKFVAERVLVKHDNQYRPPGMGERVDTEMMYNSMPGS